MAATAEGTEREGSHCSSFQQQVAVSQPHTGLKFFVRLFLLYHNCHREYRAHTSGKRCDGGRVKNGEKTRALVFISSSSSEMAHTHTQSFKYTLKYSRH